HQVDLVAIATHGAGGIRRMVLGSVADKVLRSSRRPLLVFRPKLQRIEEELREAFASATTG
ncbi:MAG: universal stress protein, partial [Gemmatimonadota bacterium]|nr:universal stress protein [Gemmatimonadota bacterium]